VAYTLLCGYEPFFGDDDQELINANKNVEFEFHMPEWGNISREAKDFICRALAANASERLTPVKAKSHPWLTGVSLQFSR
jgi:serine/threonine protein kinase